MLLDFLFPHMCVACRQAGQEKLLCAMCVGTVELLGYYERCGRCFRKKRGRRCDGCQRGMFVRKAAVFEGGSPIGILGRDEERFAKTIAAFFVIQLFRLHWPFPEAIYFPKSLKQVGKRVRRFLGLPFFSGEGSVLCISTTYEEDEVPPKLYFSELSFMAFTMDDK